MNSGLFIGYAPDIYRLVTISKFPPEGNDQLYFTQVFLNDTLRQELNFTLDYRCRIFQTVEGGPNIIDILYRGILQVFHFRCINLHEIYLTGRTAYIYNQDYKTIPLIVHTPGYFKSYVHNFANFLPNVWNPVDGCTACLEDTLHLSSARVRNQTIAIIFQ